MMLLEEYEREAYARLYKRLLSLEPRERTALEELRNAKRGRGRRSLPLPARGTPEWEHCDRLRYYQIILIEEGSIQLSPLCHYYLASHDERWPWEADDDEEEPV